MIKSCDSKTQTKKDGEPKRTLYFLVLASCILLSSETAAYAQTIRVVSEAKYKSVRIDSQVWMTENLNVDAFRNADRIPNAESVEEWISAGKDGKPAWCYYENKGENGVKYGRLYNWFAINDPRGLAPAGWHVPSDTEWSMATLFLGGEDAAGTKMKTPTGWSHDGNGTNESGFSCLPSGSRDRFGKFDYAGHVTYWWCSTAHDAEFAWYRIIDESPHYVYRTHFHKQNGYSVRCIHD